MKAGLRKVLLSAAVISLFFSCQRELYFDNPMQSSAAVFTFIPGNDSCSVFEIRGIYAAGIALSDSNSVTLTINVTTPGTYKIFSSAVNGVSFSDSGILDAAGIQNIILKGQGIPADTGIYNFKTAPDGCNISIHFLEQSAVGNANYIMAGAPGDCTDFKVTGTFRTGLVLDPSTNYVTVSVNVLATGFYRISTADINNMRFSKSGVFTSTGNKPIQLAGFGMPFHKGSDSYTVGVFPGSCMFTVTVTN